MSFTYRLGHVRKGTGFTVLGPIQTATWSTISFSSQPPLIPPTFHHELAFARLDAPVRDLLRAILAMGPDRLDDVRTLIEHPKFEALSTREQIALLTPPLPNRIDLALSMVGDVLFNALLGSKEAIFRLEPEVQRALLVQFAHFSIEDTGRYLPRLAEAPWFRAMTSDDQIRAIKLVAHASNEMMGTYGHIVRNTIEGLVGSTPRFTLEFEDLPFDDQRALAGHVEFPNRAILNRAAFGVDDECIGQGTRAEHIAFALVHEINHLVNQIPDAPTYAAFMDEYRAWYVEFLAYYQREPFLKESLDRCRDLFTMPAYPEIQKALVADDDESRAILRFMRNFGAVRSPEDIAKLEIRDRVRVAPRPEPELNLDNS